LFWKVKYFATHLGEKTLKFAVLNSISARGLKRVPQ